MKTNIAIIIVVIMLALLFVTFISCDLIRQTRLLDHSEVGIELYGGDTVAMIVVGPVTYRAPIRHCPWYLVGNGFRVNMTGDRLDSITYIRDYRRARDSL